MAWKDSLRSVYPTPTLPDPIPTPFVEFRYVFQDIESYVKIEAIKKWGVAWGLRECRLAMFRTKCS